MKSCLFLVICALNFFVSTESIQDQLRETATPSLNRVIIPPPFI